MKIRFALLAVVTALAATIPNAAHAANVTVTFGIAVATHVPTGALCPLSVPSGADGVVVLAAAKQKGCIVSYRTVPTAFGNYVACIDEICGDETTPLFLTYWAMYENGNYTDYGVDGFSAAAGDSLIFSYATWLTCLTPIGCDNQP